MTQNEIDVVNEIENGLYSEFNWLFRDNSKYVAMMKIVENAIDKYQKYIKENIRKKVCDEIRDKGLTDQIDEIKGVFISYQTLYQIEQAKESMK